MEGNILIKDFATPFLNNVIVDYFRKEKI